jgi:hypothetical protein
MTIKQLEEDRQAELSEIPYIDAVNYSGLKILGIYHDIDDKVIIQRLNGRITLNKIKHAKKGDFFEADGVRFYLDNFLKAY